MRKNNKEKQQEEKKTLEKGQRQPQELEHGPCSGLYLLVSVEIHMLICISKHSVFKTIIVVGYPCDGFLLDFFN